MFESRNSPVICSLDIVEEARVDSPVTFNVPAIVVVASAEVPVAYRLPVVNAVAEAIPKDDVPDIKVENVPVVNTGLVVTEIVEVLDNTMFDPAVKCVFGLLKNDDHCVVEEVSGTEYPDCVAIENVCIPELDVICRSSPFAVDVEKVCDASVRPFNDVSPPPAPASAPHENAPVVVLYVNLPLIGSQ